MSLGSVNNRNNYLSAPTMHQQFVIILYMWNHLQQPGGKYYETQEGKYHYPKFISDETKGQRGEETCPAS